MLKYKLLDIVIYSFHTSNNNHITINTTTNAASTNNNNINIAKVKGKSYKNDDDKKLSNNN